jgi:7-carboxy-7-deazaguanine synthase
LARHGFTAQIETSGTQPVNVDTRAWVTVSPKIGMPGGELVLRSAMQRADEIKMPVGKPADIAAFKVLLEAHDHRATALIYVQPVSGSEKATKLCRDAAIEYGWCVSIQVHALLGWR